MNLEAQEPSGSKFRITRRERAHARQESVGSCVIAPSIVDHAGSEGDTPPHPKSEGFA